MPLPLSRASASAHGSRAAAARPARASTSTLNSSPMADGSVRRNRPARSSRRRAGGARSSSRSSARLDAEGAQEGALRHRAVDRGTAGRGGLGERPEVDLGREVGLARAAPAARRRHGRGPPAACRRSGPRPRRRSRSAARPRPAPAMRAPICRGERRARRADLGDRPRRRPVRGDDLRRQRRWLRCLLKRELARAAEPDHALAPAVRGAHQLMDRQRIEELVGDQQQRARPAPPRGARASSPARPPGARPAGGAAAGCVSTR